MTWLLPALLQTIPQGVDYVRILPELVLSVFGIVVMVLDPLVDEEKSQKTAGLYRARAARSPDLLATWYHGAVAGAGLFEHGEGRRASACSFMS